MWKMAWSAFSDRFGRHTGAFGFGQVVVIVVIKHVDFEAVAVRLGVDQLFEFLAWFEIGDAFGGDVYRGSCFGVAAPPGVALAHPEAAEAAQLNLLSAIKRLDNIFEDLFDDHFRRSEEHTSELQSLRHL